VMGCYGIGISRIVAAVIEGNYDEKGIIWPLSVAPFKVLVIPVNMEDSLARATAENVYQQLQSVSEEVLLDDRRESAGMKFTDGDLIGIPLWIIVGKKAREGQVEIKVRKQQRFQEANLDNIKEQVFAHLKKMDCTFNL